MFTENMIIYQPLKEDGKHMYNGIELYCCFYRFYFGHIPLVLAHVNKGKMVWDLFYDW